MKVVIKQRTNHDAIALAEFMEKKMKPSWMMEDEQKAAERKVRVLAMMSQAKDMEKEIRLREKISYTLTDDELYHLLNNYHWRKERLINATDNRKLQGTEK